MPNLHLPFLLKSDFSIHKQIIRIQLLLKYQKIITVSSDGTMLIWQIKENLEVLEPKIFIIPSFDTKLTGNLTALTTYYIPLNYYTV